MDNKQYNQTIINFYAKTYLHIGLKDKNQSSQYIQAEVKALFDKFCDEFNAFIANEYLTQLSQNNISITDKFNNYPEQFWKTPNGVKIMNNLAQDLIYSLSQKINLSIEENEKPDVNFFNDFIENLLFLYTKQPVNAVDTLNKFYLALPKIKNIYKAKFNYSKLLFNAIIAFIEEKPLQTKNDFMNVWHSIPLLTNDS